MIFSVLNDLISCIRYGVFVCNILCKTEVRIKLVS